MAHGITQPCSKKQKPSAFKQLMLCASSLCAAVALAACIPTSFPDDKTISQALDINRSSSTLNAEEQKAHELLQTMGGEGSHLEYRIHRVIQQPVGFLVHYDAYIRLRQDGAQSLERLSDKLLRELTANSRSSTATTQQQPATKQLQEHIQQLKQQQTAEGAALEKLLQRMQHCFNEKKAGDDVILIKNLQAHLWPERNQKWYAQKLAGDMPAEIVCLPL